MLINSGLVVTKYIGVSVCLDSSLDFFWGTFMFRRFLSLLFLVSLIKYLDSIVRPLVHFQFLQIFLSLELCCSSHIILFVDSSVIYILSIFLFVCCWYCAHNATSRKYSCRIFNLSCIMNLTCFSTSALSILLLDRDSYVYM